jgi:hypothetical protein
MESDIPETGAHDIRSTVRVPNPVLEETTK